MSSHRSWSLGLTGRLRESTAMNPAPVSVPFTALWRWRQHDPSKRRYSTTSLNYVITQRQRMEFSSPWKPEVLHKIQVYNFYRGRIGSHFTQFFFFCIRMLTFRDIFGGKWSSHYTGANTAIHHKQIIQAEFSRSSLTKWECTRVELQDPLPLLILDWWSEIRDNRISLSTSLLDITWIRFIKRPAPKPNADYA